MYFPVKKPERKERMGSSFVNMSKTEALHVCDLWHINRLLHRKCDVRIFIHELQDFGKRTSERSERVSFPKSVATSE